MKQIKFSQKPNEENWAKQFMDKSNYDVLYDEDVFVRKPDGSPLMVLLKNAINLEINQQAWWALKNYSAKTTNRGTAAGTSTAPMKKKDGTYSNYQQLPKGWEVESGLVGYFERTVKTPYCHACAWNAENPEEYAALLPLIQKVDSLYKQHVPERYAVQKGYADRTQPEYMIKDSVFTTLTVNKNFRTAAHKDAGDLEAGFSCLSVIREGKFKGGELVLPNWRIAAKIDTGDLIMFDAHEYHGNCQIIPLSKKYTRCSIVYYYREKMEMCLPIEDEIQHANARKPGDKLW